jgi:hypothetical protein
VDFGFRNADLKKQKKGCGGTETLWIADLRLRNADSIKQEEDKINTEGFLSVVSCYRRKVQSEKADFAFTLCSMPYAPCSVMPDPIHIHY